MRHFLAVFFLFPSLASATEDPCVVYLRGYASLDPILEQTLEKMIQRWDTNEQVISYKTGAILGARTSVPPGAYGARIPRQDHPVEMQEIQAMDLLLNEAVQFELSNLYLGSFSHSSLKAQLRGREESQVAVVGLLPSPYRQDEVANWLKSQSDWAQVPRAVLAQPDTPVLENLATQTTSIHFGAMMAPWGNLRFKPAGRVYKLVVYGSDLEQNFAPIVGVLALHLFETPRLRNLRVEVPVKHAVLTSHRSLYELEPHELTASCNQLADHLAAVFQTRASGSGREFVIRFQGDRTLSLVFIP